jgi:IclR family KDG regulon transcriptional repressor
MATEIIKSAGRIFDVLEYFEEVRTPLTLKTISEHFGLAPSSANNILKSLVLRGYLDYDRFTRTYLPTMRMATLGHWVWNALFGEGAVLDFMETLRDEVQETVTLGVQSDLWSQHIHVLPSPRPPAPFVTPGALRPLVKSGLGYLLLSVRDDDMIEILLRRANVEEPDRSRRVALPDLLAHVNEIRAQGYAYASHQVVEGATMVGKLLPGRYQGRVMAVCVVGPTDRLDEERERIVRALEIGMAKLAADDPCSQPPEPQDGAN